MSSEANNSNRTAPAPTPMQQDQPSTSGKKRHAEPEPKKDSSNKKRPGKQAAQRKQDNFRIKKNEEFDKTVIKKMTDDFHRSLNIHVSDFAPEHSVLIECSPPKQTKISTTFMSDIVSVTMSTVKPFVKLDDPSFERAKLVVATAASWQLRAKEYYATLNTPLAKIDMGSDFNTVAMHFDTALSPVAAMVDNVGKFTHKGGKNN
ncbi:hypothetical protein LSTR_LSTR016026 [Laodelphax striatellus]|uniref:Uncharacterized protein n=1 Tax=Laodelphax striatellus TaxID=195883 RepID=A0A482X0N3_LAOST|nr:hypothetical protein LSTR_LSTR004664 [Laodelphax striatellus]RZF39096.1 hypothetical protein LSTR_LSTR016026 [Laodelphax striatellus]